LFITLGYCRIWKTAVQIFEKLFDDEVFQLIVDFSNLYASQNNRHNFSITVAELKTFFGILLLSGYHKLPREGMYWSLDEDIGVEVVSKAMSRNRFREIKRNLHLVDNNDAPNATDKMFKVRKLADILMRKFCQWNVFHELISVDESMVKYFGHHSAKQFIRGKPVRFGYKNWVAASSSGYWLYPMPGACMCSLRMNTWISYYFAAALLDFIRNNHLKGFLLVLLRRILMGYN
jgi:hypothetical protein